MKRFSIVILVGISFMIAACAGAVVDSKTAKVSVNTDKENKQVTPTLEPTLNPNEQTSAGNSSNCKAKNAVADEVIKTPESREEFNNWLSNVIGSVQVATLANRKFISEYYWKGDLNADGCEDVAVLVEGVKDKSGSISIENIASGTTVQNLRSKAIYKGGDSAKLPFRGALARQIKPQQETAVAIIFGGSKGWGWNNNVAGREFLLYDSVFKPAKVSDYEASSMLFSIVNKVKPEEDNDDLIDLFPANAVGDCIYTATEIKRKENEFSELSNKFLICYDGDIFFNKKLPGSKSYPQR